MASSSKQSVYNISCLMEDTTINPIHGRSLRRLVTTSQVGNEAAVNWSTSLLGKVFILNYAETKKEVTNLWKQNNRFQSQTMGHILFIFKLPTADTQTDISNEAMIYMNMEGGNKKRLRNEEVTEGTEIIQEDESMVFTNSNATAELGIIHQQQGSAASQTRQTLPRSKELEIQVSRRTFRVNFPSGPLVRFLLLGTCEFRFGSNPDTGPHCFLFISVLFLFTASI